MTSLIDFDMTGVKSRIKKLKKVQLRELVDYYFVLNLLVEIQHELVFSYEYTSPENKHPFVQANLHNFLSIVEKGKNEVEQNCVLKLGCRVGSLRTFNFFSYFSITKTIYEGYLDIATFESIPKRIRKIVKLQDDFILFFQTVFSVLTFQFYSQPIEKENAEKAVKILCQTSDTLLAKDPNPLFLMTFKKIENDLNELE